MTTEAREQFENGTRTLRTGNVAICAMSPQARQWLDAAIQAYCEHKDVSSDALCSDTDDAKHISVYGFAYWLFRYSGLPQRIEQAGYQAGLEAAAQIADHFANDALSPSEYPPQGVTDSRDRGDFGYIKKVSECVAAAIRQLKE